jgi:hypothetical protein
MMHVARRASLVVVLLLLASVGTASAECAWVLWMEQTTLGGGTDADVQWVASGVPTSRDCYDSLKSTMKMQSKPEAGTTIEVKSNQIVRTWSGITSILTYSCLPDTVDPRGPKTK